MKVDFIFFVQDWKRTSQQALCYADLSKKARDSERRREHIHTR